MLAIINLLSIILYFTCGAILLSKMARLDHLPAINKRHVFAIASISVLIHGVILYQQLFSPVGFDIRFFHVLSLVAWLVALLLIISMLNMQIECLGIIVFPFAAFMLLLGYLPSEAHLLTYEMKSGILVHILFSILAYSLLSIAAVQALLLYIQDSHLHNRHPGGFVRALPALETMETLLFRIILLGFVTLSIALLSGIFYLEDMFAQHIAHKTILSLVAWLLFAVLLWGRWQYGWRGRIAIRWTYSGFIVLMLAYFGSKFVIELVLNR
ncbi:MAG: cytochrome c biogenesis protein CcsA [Gammaproteobacteria bacterium]|nr:cytochrome c biogenesis protein CcsA [Gammaproteobacteria bacterium]